MVENDHPSDREPKRLAPYPFCAFEDWRCGFTICSRSARSSLSLTSRRARTGPSEAFGRRLQLSRSRSAIRGHW